MSKLIDGTVIKAVGGVFTVWADRKYVCFAPKKLRFNDFDVLVGDKVKFSIMSAGKGVIEEILPRRNQLKRPEVANIDYAFILLAIVPEPDLTLIDKIIINCFYQKVTPVIVINKCDISDDSFISSVKSDYSNVCDIIVISTVTGAGVDKLYQYIAENTVCMAGQSAVGKTSLLNYLCPELNKEVGELSEKSNRGMHTTRHSQIYATHGGFIVDTTGFSLLELNDDIDYRELMLYYDDMVSLSRECKFPMCTHTVEPDCAVKHAVEAAAFSKGRYDRYVEIYKQIEEFDKTKYNKRSI